MSIKADELHELSNLVGIDGMKYVSSVIQFAE